VIGLFLSIVLHEFGHSVIARKFGIPMRGITLFIFGGVAEMGGHPPSPKSEFFMALAGPLVTVVLTGVFVTLNQLGDAMSWPASWTGVFTYLAWINFVLLAFNLVPAFPLDGGRVLRSILWAWKKNLRWATRIASFLGTAFALLLIAWGVFNFMFGNFVAGIWYLLIGLFIRNASQVSYQQVLMREALSGEPIRRFMTTDPLTVTPNTSVRQIVDDFLYKYPYKSYPVVSDGNLLGCVTLDRVKDVPREEWNARTAESLATPCSPDNTIEPDADAVKALSKMTHSQASRLMVVDHGQLIGIVALKDLANFLSRKLELEQA
jgi:Zn-dependent protease/CBS domain-containing protein